MTFDNSGAPLSKVKSENHLWHTLEKWILEIYRLQLYQYSYSIKVKYPANCKYRCEVL